MRLPGEEEQESMGGSVIVLVLGMIFFVTIVFALVLKSNEKPDNRYLKEETQKQLAEAAAQEEIKEETVVGTLRAEDLDFWDMYPVEEADEAETNQKTGIESNDGNQEMQGDIVNKHKEDTTSKKSFAEKAELDRQEIKQKEQEAIENDPSKDGKHTMVKNRDGSEEWILISPYLTKNTYDFTNLEEKAHIKRYMENGRNVSYVGVDLSKDNGVVSFDAMKATGVDYVMLKIGSRGYSTGHLTPDEKFEEYAQGAIDAGIQIGAYFVSNAITMDEVNEEKNFVIQKLAPFKQNIKYPVVFRMGFTPNAESRIDGLSVEDRTSIATAFLEGVKAEGYVPMLYGNKEWLLKEVNLTKLTSYDIWYTEEADVPDYPYRFAMWQYTTQGVLNGTEGDTNLNIGFVNYAER